MTEPAAPTWSDVIVGVDGSSESKAALRWAVEQAHLTGQTVKAVMAWRQPMDIFGYALPSPIANDIRLDCEKSLGSAVEEASVAHPDVKISSEVVEGLAPLVLLDEAKGADLLVVGSRGHGAFTGMLLGSVSQHCVTHATCPVVVVHPDSGARPDAGADAR